MTDEEILVRDAPMIAESYLRKAVESIDKIFGEGFAKRHPDLISAFLLCRAQAYDSDRTADAISSRHRGE